MKVSMRSTGFGVLAVALSLALSACKPLDKDTGKAIDGSDDAKPATVERGGLKTEREQVSHVIGSQIGESLREVKDEVDLDTVFKAVRRSVDGEDSLISQEDAMQLMQEFGRRVQERQVAKLAEDAKKNADEGAAFLAENAKKPDVKSTASGLQYQVITEGTGAKPAAGDSVRVHYKGTLLDGETFDDSYARGEPVEFALAQVVPGWQEGLQLMPVGSKYKLWIPGSLGYGEQGTPGGPIAPNATLVFEVELLDIVKK